MMSYRTLDKSTAMCEPTSIPTSSANVAAPTGKPNCLVMLSRSLGSTPSWSNLKNHASVVRFLTFYTLAVFPRGMSWF